MCCFHILVMFDMKVDIVHIYLWIMLISVLHQYFVPWIIVILLQSLININILNIDQSAQLFFYNNVPSSKFQYQESSNEIKENARNTYKTQYRLITSKDFENYIFKNYSSLIQDIKCVDNNQYVNEHLQYLNSIGLSKPNLDSRILFNQVNFGTSCNFNNIYIYCVPKIPKNNVMFRKIFW
jgi:hypothetical protein